jgi:hypothetical protein
MNDRNVLHDKQCVYNKLFAKMPDKMLRFVGSSEQGTLSAQLKAIPRKDASFAPLVDKVLWSIDSQTRSPPEALHIDIHFLNNLDQSPVVSVCWRSHTALFFCSHDNRHLHAIHYINDIRASYLQLHFDYVTARSAGFMWRYVYWSCFGVFHDKDIYRRS